MTQAVIQLPDSPRNAAIASLRAAGESFRAIGRKIGVDPTTAMRVSHKNAELIEQKRQKQVRNVLQRFDDRHADALYSPLDARHIDAGNPESRTGAQSFGQMLIMAGYANKGSMRDMHIHGNVDASTNVDARSVKITESDEQLAARIAELRRRLG